MTNELKVAEGILDSAAEEYLASNLASADSVEAYAEHGMGITDFDSEKVLRVCREWVRLNSDGNIAGTNDYHHTVVAPLS